MVEPSVDATHTRFWWFWCFLHCLPQLWTGQGPRLCKTKTKIWSVWKLGWTPPFTFNQCTHHDRQDAALVESGRRLCSSSLYLLHQRCLPLHNQVSPSNNRRNVFIVNQERLCSWSRFVKWIALSRHIIRDRFGLLPFALFTPSAGQETTNFAPFCSPTFRRKRRRMRVHAKVRYTRINELKRSKRPCVGHLDTQRFHLLDRPLTTASPLKLRKKPFRRQEGRRMGFSKWIEQLKIFANFSYF